jgi:hypothetical protein
MSIHQKFKIDTKQDLHASFAAIMAVLRVMLEQRLVDREAVRAVLAELTQGDPDLQVRAEWLTEFLAGLRNTEGDETI